jgi:hypothetical protein
MENEFEELIDELINNCRGISDEFIIESRAALVSAIVKLDQKRHTLQEEVHILNFKIFRLQRWQAKAVAFDPTLVYMQVNPITGNEYEAWLKLNIKDDEVTE